MPNANAEMQATCLDTGDVLVRCTM